jgi:hypothetical protein
VAIVTLIVALAAFALADSGSEPARPCIPAVVEPVPAASAVTSSAPAYPLRPKPNRVSWLAFGGGADPPSNQISIEQNLQLASRTLAERGEGVLLFAGGPRASWVQQLDRTGDDGAVLTRLGEIFAPRPDRATAYRQSALASHGAATQNNVLAELDRALAQPAAGSLMLVVAAHGDPGATAADTAVVLWGGQVLTARDLAQRLDRAGQRRPVRLVMSSCFSGGFAEIAFADADPDQGGATGERCGLFASTWDREASGCDPDPDRRAQEGYALYFWNALKGADRHGTPVERGGLDIDGDGRISLLEAHTQVRIASRSISIPTTTSERWLRHAAPQSGPERTLALPEEDAVIVELGRRLSSADEGAARQRRAKLMREIDMALGALEQLEIDRDDALLALQMSLLERWPVIDDPYHSTFATMVADDETAIRAALETEPPALAYGETQANVDRLADGIGKLEVHLALIERLLRAYETRSLAARLHARGGPPLERYRALLSCERAVLGSE